MKAKKIISFALIMVMAISVAFAYTPVSVEAASSVTRISDTSVYNTSVRTANAYKKELGVSKFNAIIIARGDFYSDALSGSYLANAVKAPILLVGNSNVSDAAKYVNTNLKAGGTVYILGGPKAVSEKYDNCFDKSKGFTVTRLGGNSQYDTNLLILEEGDKKYAEANNGKVNKNVLICTGESYYDGLSAGATGNPIRLVNNTIYSGQATYLSQRGTNTITIIGGPKAVANRVDTQAKKYGSVSRCYGNSLYDTAVAVAKKFFGKKPKEVILTSGTRFQEGIMAGPLAQAKKCPVVFVSSSNIAPAYNYQMEANRPVVTIIGGANHVATKAAAASKVFAKGWNAYGNGYVFINRLDEVTTYSFTDRDVPVKPNAGGMISSATYKEVERRKVAASYGTAIVIHLKSQKLEYIRNGVIKLSVPVTTGKNASPTPTGTYYVRAKTRNTSLSGYDSSGNWYSRPVSYWMPFIGNSYGIHDASWRSQFGVPSYTYNGSMGCVNVPLADMGKLYNMVSVGTKIVIQQY